MRRRSLLRPGFTASLLLALTLSFGCMWKGHVKKGDEFLAAGNYDMAATEYAEALRLHPGDEEIIAKLGEAQVGQIEVRARQAQAALDANDNPLAVRLAAEAHAILPGNPKTIALVDHVVDVTGGRAKQMADAGKFAEAMVIYDGIAAGLPSAHARVEADMQAVVQAWIAHLSSVASEAEAAGRTSTALLCRTKIVSLGNQGQAERDALREQVSASLSYLVVIKAKGNEAGAVADALVGRHGTTLLEVARAGDRPSATLTLTLGKPKFSTDKHTRQESVDYQSGTKQVPNPFYKMAQDDLVAEEGRLVDRENEVTKQEQYVSQYSADVAREGDTPGVTTGAEQNLYNAENRLEAAQRAVVDQRNAVQRAREKAASTPQTKEEAVYSTHTYTVTTHQLTAGMQVQAKLEHGDGRPALVMDQPLSVTAQDDTFPAQSVAGIAEDPLTLPSKDQLAGELYGQAAPLVGSVIAESFVGHRQKLREQATAASDPNEKLELLLRYLMLDAQNTEPEIVAEIFTLSGVPDAAKLLLSQ